MDLSKNNLKKLLGVITFGIVLFAVSQNLSAVGAFLEGVLGLFAPVIIGFTLAFMLNIILNVVERRVFAFMKKSKKPVVRKLFHPVSLVSTLLLTFGFFVLLLFIILPQLKDTIMLLIEKIPVYYQSLVEWIDSIINRFGLDISTEFLHNPKFNINDIYVMVQDFFTSQNGNDILNTTMGVTSSLVSGVTNIVLGFIIAIYVLAEKTKIIKFTNRILAAAFSEKINNKIHEICNIASNSFASFITGQFTDATILAVLTFIGMLIFGFPNAAVVSVIIGISALVPVIGPIVGEIIGCLIIFMDSPVKALLFLIFVLVLQAVDNNFIYPKIMGKSVGIPGLLVFIAVIIGGNLGGILGVLLGVPTASAIYALVVNWLKNKGKTKALENTEKGSKEDNEKQEAIEIVNKTE